MVDEMAGKGITPETIFEAMWEQRLATRSKGEPRDVMGEATTDGD